MSKINYNRIANYEEKMLRSIMASILMLVIIYVFMLISIIFNTAQLRRYELGASSILGEISIREGKLAKILSDIDQDKIKDLGYIKADEHDRAFASLVGTSDNVSMLYEYRVR